MSPVASYSGQLGNKPSSTPNPMTGATGINFQSTVYPWNQLATLSSSMSTSYCGTTLNSETRFRIMSSNDGPGTGNNRGKDPCTNFDLPYAPTHLDNSITKSIRIGNCRISAEAEALYYTMNVTPLNALLFVYYAIVVQAPGHGISGDPTFIVRVTKQNAGGAWSQISDTLCYMVSSTPTSMTGGTVVIGQNGWHSIGSGYDQVYYKDWNKVAISLNKYLYQTVRVEMMIADCSASGHYGYCYVAGDCQPMQIKASGCPSGASAVIDTLASPAGLTNYAWYRSRSGAVEDIYNVPADVHFDLIPGSSGATNNTYLARLTDFDLTEGPYAGTVANTQTFMCQMTSAMDPAKPFVSKVYVNVDNAKPQLAIDTTIDCDGNIRLTNQSYSGTENLDPTKTRWIFHEDSAAASAPIYTISGDSAEYRFDEPGYHSVYLHVETENTSADDDVCYTERKIVIRTLGRPTPQISVDPASRELCLNQECTISDATPGSTWRMWAVPRANGVLDTTYNQSSIVRSFDFNPVPIYLTARNGMYYLNPADRRETIWCEASTTDTIHVFTAPELHVSPDTIVCNGQQTHVTISTDVENCTYTWYRHLNQAGEAALQTGNVLRQTPYADRSTYYVKVTSPQGCEAWDSVTVYVVRPAITMEPSDGRICPGETATLYGTNADHFSWVANPEDASLLGQESRDTIVVSPSRTTTYTMTGHGSDGCSADPLTKTVTVLDYPVPAVSMSPNFVDSENPVVKFSDVSPNSTASLWDFGNGETSTLRTVEHTFTDLKKDSAEISLRTSNILGCSSDTTFRIPIQLFAVWFPNAFTPNLEHNNVFKLYTSNQLEFFRLFIYDRRGALVYSTTDQNFEWNGTARDRDCPQGAYVYTCTYRRPGTEDVVMRKGTVLLVR